MALFKISKGSETNLPTNLNEGYAYFTEDTNNFYIDISDNERKLLGIGKNKKVTDDGYAVEIGKGEVTALGKNAVAEGLGDKLGEKGFSFEYNGNTIANVKLETLKPTVKDIISTDTLNIEFKGEISLGFFGIKIGDLIKKVP